MSKLNFKVGDRVVGTDIHDGVNLNGLVGTIKTLNYSSYGVEFDEGNTSFHTCGGTCKYGHGWNVPESKLKLVEKEKTIVIYSKGNQVIAHNKSTGEKAVAKCSPEDTFDFNIGAKLAFERLMGTVTTNIVKQEKYAVGDKVKIVDAWVRECYPSPFGTMDKYLGTVMTISRICDGKYRMVEDNESWYWYPNAIEGKVVGNHEAITTDVKEVKRHAKIGEYIKIVKDGYYTASDYEVGDILKVTEFHGNPEYGDVNTINLRTNKETVYVKPEEYVVLEGYKPAEEPKKLYNGKVVCIEGFGNLTTKGKIYEFKDGSLTYDNGNKCCSPVTSFEEICEQFSSKFIEVVE